MTAPTFLQLGNGAEWQCYTYDTLVILKHVNLKQRAIKLRDQLGTLADIPQLRTTAPNEDIATWVVETQAAIAGCSAAAYGAPVQAPPSFRISESEALRIKQEGQALPFVPVDDTVPVRRKQPHGLPLVSAAHTEFTFSPAFTGAAKQSGEANLENRHRNQTGQLAGFLFRDADHVAPVEAAPFTSNPPFQIAPPEYPPGTAGTISATSYRPPPPGYQGRQPVCR